MLPESPRWLAGKGEWEGAREVLRCTCEEEEVLEVMAAMREQLGEDTVGRTGTGVNDGDDDKEGGIAVPARNTHEPQGHC